MSDEPLTLIPVATTEPVTLAPAGSALHPDDVSPPWKVRDALVLVAGLVGLSLLLQALVPQHLRQTPTAIVVVNLVWVPLMIAGAILVVRFRGGDQRHWFVGRGPWYVEVALGIAFVIPLILLGAGVNLLARFLMGPPEMGQRAAMTIGQLPLTPRLVMAFDGIVLAPLAEEMLFRGLLLSSLRARIGWWAAWILQAAVFAVAHQDALQVTVGLFSIGLGLGALYVWRRSLLASFTLHAGFNTLPMMWMIALLWINQHDPAATWEQAEQPPSWWSSPLVEQLAQSIPQRDTAAEQWEEARNFGSRGPQLWKVEIRAFDRIRERFPDDAEYAAKSLNGIQEAYLYYLHDPRRAIVYGRRLIEQYPDQRESHARALFDNAIAYKELGDHAEATRLAQQAIESFSDVPSIREPAQVLLDELKR